MEITNWTTFIFQLLESIIGFSVAEFETIKLGAKENPIMKEKLAEVNT